MPACSRGDCAARVRFLRNNNAVTFELSKVLVEPKVFEGGLDALAMLQLKGGPEAVAGLGEPAPLFQGREVPKDACPGPARLSTVGWGGGPLGPHVQAVDVEGVAKRACKAQMREDRAESSLFPPDEAVTKDVMCGSLIGSVGDRCQGELGAPLLITIPPSNASLLVGVTVLGQGCLWRGAPALFSKVVLSSEQWVRSVLGAAIPPRRFRLSIDSIQLPPGGSVVVYRGAAQSPEAVAAILSNCSAGEELDDGGAGGFLLTLSAPPPAAGCDAECRGQYRLQASYAALSCEELVEVEPWGCGDLRRGGMSGCLDVVGDAGEWTGCKTELGCKLGLSPRQVSVLKAEGKAFSGGRPSDPPSSKWVCVRDWDPAQQRACGLGPGELGCFERFKDERFAYLGPQSKARIIKEARAQALVDAELSALAAGLGDVFFEA